MITKKIAITYRTVRQVARPAAARPTVLGGGADPEVVRSAVVLIGCSPSGSSTTDTAR